MEQLLSRTLIVGAMSLCVGAFSVAACTHTTDRVIVPVGGGDASTTAPETGDASVAPIGPVARSHRDPEPEPPPDFSLVRSPEVGAAIERNMGFSDVHYLEVKTAVWMQALPSVGGGAGAGGRGGEGGSDHRPVSTGGSSYF
jgi:hypothetical protein